MDFEPAWARVSILLNTGDIEAATAAAIAASSLTRWRWDFGDYQNSGNMKIYDTPLLPVGWMWFEPDPCRVLLSRDAVSEFGLSEGMWNYAELVHRLAGPTFRSYDPASWRSLDAIADAQYGDVSDQ